MIDPHPSKDGVSLISTAIGELMEDASAEAIHLDEGDWKVALLKADKLKSIGNDVAGLPKAMAILARRSRDPA